jgi:hypothetical protein
VAVVGAVAGVVGEALAGATVAAAVGLVALGVVQPAKASVETSAITSNLFINISADTKLTASNQLRW